MSAPIEREEHEEFRRRMEGENRRQDTRIGLLEENMRRLEALNTSIEKLAVNMECMLKEQVEQGKRLGILEARDGETWRSVMGHAMTAVVGIVIGYIFKQIGM